MCSDDKPDLTISTECFSHLQFGFLPQKKEGKNHSYTPVRPSGRGLPHHQTVRTDDPRQKEALSGEPASWQGIERDVTNIKVSKCVSLDNIISCEHLD